MVIYKVSICRVVFESLKGVSYAAWYEDRLSGVYFSGKYRPKAVTLAQINPSAKNTPRSNRDILIPWLCMDTTSDTALCVKLNIMLYRSEVGQAKIRHLGMLPVFLEPPATIAMYG